MRTTSKHITTPNGERVAGTITEYEPGDVVWSRSALGGTARAWLVLPDATLQAMDEVTALRETKRRADAEASHTQEDERGGARVAAEREIYRS